MNIVGPSRLILLRAGKYDYGEVELINPLHLVGPNNVGKTSLIAVLQFLYIDDQRSMHFSRELADTRKYYFPDHNSYLLFECLTPVGYQVVGVQGLGPIRAYEFQRFAYQGQYDPVDYLDEQQRLRTPEEVRARLAVKGFCLLEPRHLRAALTGIGDNRGVNLGLVPIRQREHYERFRAVFGNLLRLAHLRQDELKRLLLEIHRGEFQQRVIDLETGYSSQYRKVCNETEALRELRAIVEDVRRVLELAAERDGLRRQLPGIWEEIKRTYIRVDAEIAAGQQQLEEQLAALGAEEGRLDEQEQEYRRQQEALLEDLGRINFEIEQHRREAEEFADFLADFAESSKNELELQMGRLDASLAQSTDITGDIATGRVRRMEIELAGLRRRLAEMSRSAAAELLPLLADTAPEQLFRLLNPEILSLVQGEDGLIIKDKEQLGALLARVGAGIDKEFYEDRRVRLKLAALNPPELDIYLDARSLSGRIAEQEAALERERRLLAACEEVEQVRAEKKRLRLQWRQLNDRLARYRAHQERQPAIKQRHGEKEEQEKRRRQLAKELAQLTKRRQEVGEKKRAGLESKRELAARQDNILKRLRKLTEPDPDWPVAAYESEGVDLDDLMELYTRQYRQHDDTARRFAEELRRIEQRTYGKYHGEDEAATLANLQAEVEALQEREKAAQELWKSLAAGLQSAFKGLNRDLQTLTMRLDELNRRLARVSISNLTRLRLIPRPRPEWTNRIKTVSEVEALPLFTDKTAVNEAQHKLGELLSQHRRVELADLFDLHFEVTSSDGQTRRYPHLDSIESNGTTITIKVLVNLLLLKGLLGDKEISMPYYLDEASSLDRDNLTAIVQESRKMGFLAVLASPEAMEAADSLYFLREHQGRVVLKPETSLVRIERSESDGG